MEDLENYFGSILFASDFIHLGHGDNYNRMCTLPVATTQIQIYQIFTTCVHAAELVFDCDQNTYQMFITKISNLNF